MKNFIPRSGPKKLYFTTFSYYISTLIFPVQASRYSWPATEKWHSKGIRSTLGKLNVVEDETLSLVWILIFLDKFYYSVIHFLVKFQHWSADDKYILLFLQACGCLVFIVSCIIGYVPHVSNI